MNFKELNPAYAKYSILAEKNGFILAKDVDAKDFYVFGTEYNFNFSFFPTNQCGTLSKVLGELKRWKKEVDFENTFMLEIEIEFIKSLQEIV